jgi:hypothetical protein
VDQELGLVETKSFNEKPTAFQPVLDNVKNALKGDFASAGMQEQNSSV